MDSLDEKLAALGTERERSLLLDIERREQIVTNLFMKAARLNAPLPLASFDIPFDRPPSSTYYVGEDGTPIEYVTTSGTESSVPSLSHSMSAISLCASSAFDSDDADHKSDLNSSTSPLDDLTASIAAVAAENVADVIDDYTFMVRDFYPPRVVGLKQVCHATATAVTATAAPVLHKSEKEESQCFREELQSPNEEGSVAMIVVFDGPNRTICDFNVRLPSLPLLEQDDKARELDSAAEVKEMMVEANVEEVGEDEDWVQRHLIYPDILDLDSRDILPRNKKIREASLEVVLSSYCSLDAQETVILGDKVKAL